MPPSTALVAVGPTPWSHEDVVASREYKILVQFSTPKDICVTVNKSLWPGVRDLPDEIEGKVLQWVNKQRIQIKINWKEPDGTWMFDTDDLHTLLAHGLKLVNMSRVHVERRCICAELRARRRPRRQRSGRSTCPTWTAPSRRCSVGLSRRTPRR